MSDRGNAKRTAGRERKRRHKNRTRALESVTYLALIGLGASAEQAHRLSRALVVEQRERLKAWMRTVCHWDYEAMIWRTA